MLHGKYSIAKKEKYLVSFFDAFETPPLPQPPSRYYNGPQKSSPEHKGSSQRNYGKGPCSPGVEFDDETHPTKAPAHIEHSKVRHLYDRDDDAESSHKNEFRRPRDTLLNMVGEFVARSSVRLTELNKKSQDGKTIELLDSKCHVVRRPFVYRI